MKTKDQLINLMINYKSENYPLYRTRSAIGSVKAGSLYDLIKRHSDIEGEVAEVGVWRGGSAIMLADLLPNKDVFIFDTFEGLPYNHKQDNHHVKNDFNDVDYNEVKETLLAWPNIKIYKGIFPDENSEVIADKKFSIVHIDTDMYKAYLDCFEFFYDKMTVGGIILLDDYNEPTCQGATIATHEFLEDKPEIVESLGTQYYIIKK